MHSVLGVDGGGTRTRAVLVDTLGRLIGHGSASGSNIHDRSAEATAHALRCAVTAAQTASAANASGQDATLPRAACLALAGVVTPADRSRARDAAVRSDVLDARAPLLIENDGAAAVMGAHMGAPGVVLIAGTGSACYARDASGVVHRIGGWGWLLGDEGSGAWLGREALTAITHAADGRGPSTDLTSALLAQLRCRAVDELLYRVHVEGLDRAGFAALAPTVFAIASSGDQVAEALLARAVDALAVTAETALRTIAIASAPIAMVGGVATNPRIARSVEVRLSLTGNSPRIVDPALPPVFGAAALALATLAPLTDTVWRNLQQSAHDAAAAAGGSTP